MELVIVSTSQDWWGRLSPLKQRAHVARHPKGKVAKKVLNGKFKFKPMRGAHDPIPVGEEVDTPEEQRKLAKYAHVDLETLKEANPDEAEDKEKNTTKESDAQGNSAPDAGTSKFPSTHGTINSIISKISAKDKAGVSKFYTDFNSGKLKGTLPKSTELLDAVTADPDSDAVVDKFKSGDSAALKSTYRSLKKAFVPYSKTAAVLGLFAASIPLGVIPAILAISYLHHKFDEHLENVKSNDGEDSAQEDASRKLKEGQEKRLIESKRKSLGKKEFKAWLDQYQEFKDLQTSNSYVHYLSVSANADDEGIATMVHDMDRWFRHLDFEKIKGSGFKSESAAGLRLILSPTLKYFEPVHHKQYLLVCGNKLVGTVNWDMGMGDPHPDIYGWKATMRDGFPESSFHTERDPNNKYAPYTVIHKGEIKLHNPARMNLDTAFAWAKSIFKGMEDAKTKDDLDAESGLDDSEQEL